MKRLAVVSTVGLAVNLGAHAFAQPAGEYISFTPSGSGTATWQSAAGAWLVVLDPTLSVGQQISITVEGHHADGQPNPGITDLRIDGNSAGTQILLTVDNIHHIDRLLKWVATSPDTVVISADLDVFLGQTTSGPAVDVDEIRSFYVPGGVQNELICSGDIVYFFVGSNLYGDVTVGGDLKQLIVGRRIAADSSGTLVTYDIGGSIDYMEAGEIHADITVGGWHAHDVFGAGVSG